MRSGETWQPAVVLLYLTGSSCSGKTTLALNVATRLTRIAVHDVDEPGAPHAAPTEYWVCRALYYQERGIDMLLVGQAPLGEVLAAPSATSLDGIAMCLIDVADEVRRDRLAQRDPGKWDLPAIDDFVEWARWHRGHARNPRYRPEVLLDGALGAAWERWTGWRADDPRWSTQVLDTTGQAVEYSAGHVEAWIAAQREAQRTGTLPLRRGWDSAESPRVGEG